MKHIILIALLFLSFKSFSQCSINVSSSADGTLIYETSYENIFKNNDLENGIQAAYLKLVVYQNSSDINKLQFFININSAKKGSKILLVPRQLIINFSDGTNLNLQSEELKQIKSQNGFYTQESIFRISGKIYEDLQIKSVSNIILNDTRTNGSFDANPYTNLILQQANCIASKIK